MKTYIKYLIVLLVACSGCSKDDNTPQVNVGNELETALKTRYPGAKNITWERKNTYMVAVFNLNGIKTTAWYDADSYWYMTENDISFSELPDKVASAFTQDNQTRSATVNYIKGIVRATIEPIYVVGIDAAGEQLDKYYSEDGVLVKTQDKSYRLFGDFRYEIAPKVDDMFLEFISGKYEGAKLMEVDIMFPGMVYITFVHDGMVKISEFTLSGFWNSTRWTVNEDYIGTNHPEVADYFEGLGYTAGYTLVGIEFCQMYDEDYYMYTLRDGVEKTVVTVSLREVYEPLIAG